MEDVTLRQFLDATWTFGTTDQYQLKLCRFLEPYQTGKKPHAVRIKGTARNGSIVRVDVSRFKRQPARFIESTGKTIQTPAGPYPERVNMTTEYDKPTIHHYQSERGPATTLGGYLHLDPYSLGDNRVAYLLDDGTDVTNKIGLQAEMELLLDYDGPTEWVRNTKSKAQREAEQAAAVSNIQFTDRFGQVCNVGDNVIFTDKEYSKDALTGAGINFGRIKRYLPKGGVVIQTMQGDERRIISLFATMMVKLDKDLMTRVMLGKLGQDLVDAE